MIALFHDEKKGNRDSVNNTTKENIRKSQLKARKDAGIKVGFITLLK